MRLSCKKLQIGHWCCKTDFSAMAATLGKAHFLDKSDHIILQLESHFQQNLNERKSKCLLCSIMHRRSHVFVFLLLHLASFPRCVAQCPSRTNTPAQQAVCSPAYTVPSDGNTPRRSLPHPSPGGISWNITSQSPLSSLTQGCLTRGDFLHYTCHELQF